MGLLVPLSGCSWVSSCLSIRSRKLYDSSEQMPESFSMASARLNHRGYSAPSQFGPQRSQRIATVLIYLSDVEEGGETIFKREGLGNGNRVITDWRSCDDGFKNSCTLTNAHTQTSDFHSRSVCVHCIEVHRQMKGNTA
eukprot:1151967-Pelagomonas_calceolata.AAC.3